MSTPDLPETIPEDEAVNLNLDGVEKAINHGTGSQSTAVRPTAVDDLFLGKQQERRDRRRRQKQWSDGVISMAHIPVEEQQRINELEEIASKWQRPLRFASETDGGGGGLDFGIPTTKDVDAHIEEEHGKESWRFQVMQFLHQAKVQYFFMGLLVLDVIILFVEVTLMALFPFCDIIMRDAISCIPPANASDVSFNDIYSGRALAGEYDSYDVCSEDINNPELEWLPIGPEYPVGCDDHKWHMVHQLELGLFIITMMILSCFFVELNVLMVVLKPQVFFRQVFYLLDYIIIGLSLVLELFFKLAHEDLTASLVGFLVVVRSWRYVRISHGIMEVTAELADRKFCRLLNYTEQLEALIEEHGLACPQDEKVTKIRTEKEVELAAQVRRHHAEEKRLHKEQNSADGLDGSTHNSSHSSSNH